ncbi:MAG TPA: DUF4097 family beta strand repeat-containing protein [Candidatus Acidoferrales bacterium]|nr:DUF4097 family beta strand repeat-containing protein [Candidatus Acidoferrales bacterium]
MTTYYRQRRSIFTGLLLILLGVLFLFSELRPEWDLWDFFYRYWPLLLILLGIAKFFDHFMATRTGEVRPPAITGGEIALIIVLFFVLGSIVAVHRVKRQLPDLGIDVDMGDMFEHPYDWTTSLPVESARPNEVVSISTPRGNISVHPSADDKLHVIVHKTASASDESEARKRADAVNVTVTATSGGYEIRPQESGDQASRVRVDLEVQLPSQSSITAQASHGNITVIQMNGPLTVNSRSGDLDIHDITGDVSLDMSHGDTRLMNVRGNVRLNGAGTELDLTQISGDVTINGDFFGPIRARNVSKSLRYTSSRTNLLLEHLSGQVELDSGDLNVTDLPGSIQLTTSNKDVSLDNVTGHIELTGRRGNITVQFATPPREDVRITNDSANIEVTLPAQSSFDIMAVSRSGEIENDFQGAALKITTTGDTKVLQGSYGTRGPHITLNNTYGTISIHKKQ